MSCVAGPQHIPYMNDTVCNPNVVLMTTVAKYKYPRVELPADINNLDDNTSGPIKEVIKLNVNDNKGHIKASTTPPEDFNKLIDNKNVDKDFIILV